MIGDTRVECCHADSSQDTPSPPAGGLGGGVEPGGTSPAGVDGLLSYPPQCRANLPAVRHQSADLLSLVASVRAPGPEHPGRPLASPPSPTTTHVDRGTGRAGAGAAAAVSTLGQGQAGSATGPGGTPRVGFHGGTHPR